VAPHEPELHLGIDDLGVHLVLGVLRLVLRLILLIYLLDFLSLIQDMIRVWKYIRMILAVPTILSGIVA
jgi:hypothetical protein